MIIAHKNNTLRQKSSRTIDLSRLVPLINENKQQPFEYLGLKANNLTGPLGIIRKAIFQIINLVRLRPILPHTLDQLITKEYNKYDSIVVRGERGKIVFDYKSNSYVLNRLTEEIKPQRPRHLANRIAQTEYSFTAGTKGIYFAGSFYFTSDIVELVASNEFAFAVAGGSTIQIFEDGQSYAVEAKAKKICWGPEGLYFVNDKNELCIVKEFRYGSRRYEIRYIRNIYHGLVADNAELVGCDKLMCIVYRSESSALNIDVVNGPSIKESLPYNIERSNVHFGCFYWQQTLTVYFILGDDEGRLTEYYEKCFKII